MAKGIAKSMPWGKIETKDVKKASYSGLDRSGGSAVSSVDELIRKHGEGTGNVVGQSNQKEKG
jgi:hypothetical protein